MNWLFKKFESVGNVFSHPLKAFAGLFESESDGEWFFALLSMTGWFLLSHAAPQIAQGMSIAVNIVIGVGIFFFVWIMLLLAPTGEEHWGRAKERKVSKFIFNWVFGLVVAAFLFVSFLFIHFMA